MKMIPSKSKRIVKLLRMEAELELTKETSIHMLESHSVHIYGFLIKINPGPCLLTLQLKTPLKRSLVYKKDLPATPFAFRNSRINQDKMPRNKKCRFWNHIPCHSTNKKREMKILSLPLNSNNRHTLIMVLILFIQIFSLLNCIIKLNSLSSS